MTTEGRIEATRPSGRDATHTLAAVGAWLPSEAWALAEQETTWVRRLFRALTPYEQGVYINFLDRDDRHRLTTAYQRDTRERLIELKNRYDPDDVFHLNSHLTANYNHASQVRSREP